MEVTTQNFDAAVQKLAELLPTSSFISFDEEMTGIILNKETQPTIGDSPEDR